MLVAADRCCLGMIVIIATSYVKVPWKGKATRMTRQLPAPWSFSAPPLGIVVVLGSSSLVIPSVPSVPAAPSASSMMVAGLRSWSVMGIRILIPLVCASVDVWWCLRPNQLPCLQHLQLAFAKTATTKINVVLIGQFSEWDRP